MATSLPPQRPTALAAEMLPITGTGRDTGHIKEVPQPKALREQLRAAVEGLAAGLDKSRPLGRHEMERLVRRLLAEWQLPEAYVGWTMVALASAFWHDQVSAVPPERRLVLLPDCLRNAATCPAEFDEMGLLCEDCGDCSLTDLRAEARRKGYKVMIAEGSPTVMKIILGGYVDALLGVACLDVLEKTLDKILLAGIPCMAVPLLSCGCKDTSADEDWIRRMFDTEYRPAAGTTCTYLHLMRCAAKLFEADELKRLVPNDRDVRALAESNGEGLDGLEPIDCTGAIALDFLASGGKHSRPFITLAAYDAVTGGHGIGSDGAAAVAGIGDAVKSIALAIEVFHKASLVHDDIEDDDSFRYGQETLHRKYGSPTAINVGDYLIGLGYRLVAAGHKELPAETVADVLAIFAQAHMKLCQGQGAELVWRDARQKQLQPIDALKIYALKTAPAFEAALMAGIRLAGPVEPYCEAAARFSRHLGVAYQIINDLDDWQIDQRNKRQSGTDVLGGRPTVLWAFALQQLDEQGRSELESLVGSAQRDEETIARADKLYEKAGAYGQAAALISKHHQRALEAADRLDNEPLRRLLHFLADAILDRRPLAINEE